MLVETRKRPETQTFRTVRGVSYRVRKIETFRFSVYRQDGQWVEPRSAREETSFVRLGLPCICVSTTHETLSRSGSRSTFCIREVYGEYDYVSEYLDTVACVGCVSFRNRSGMRAELHLTENE